VAAGDDPTADALLKASKASAKQGHPAIRFAMGHADLVGLVDEMAASLAAELPRALAIHGRILDGYPEWGFGLDGDADVEGSAPRCEIDIDGQTAFVRGSVDLLRVTECDGHKALHVIDYKTWAGKAKPGELARGIHKGVAIQVPFYALVALKCRDGGAFAGLLPDPPAAVTLAYDRLRHAKTLDGIRPVQDGVEVDLVKVEKLLGALLRRARQGRFPLVPHADKCPKLADRGAFCDFGDVCRFRQHAGAQPEFGSEDDSEGGSDE